MSRMNFLWQPIRAFKWRYFPVLIIYFSYGLSAMTGIGESFFIKEKMDFSAEFLISMGVWLTLPWTLKMIIGQCVDHFYIFNSNRRVYIWLGVLFLLLGAFLMLGLASQWSWLFDIFNKNLKTIYFLSAFCSVTGAVIQDVVADTLSVEVVDRGKRSDEKIDEKIEEIAMVQLLGRLSLSLGIVLVSGLGGYLAEKLSYEKLFLLGFIPPVLTFLGTWQVSKLENKKKNKKENKKINIKILLGGVIYALLVIGIGVFDIPFGQEIVLIISLGIIIYLLKEVVKNIPKSVLASLIATAGVIFIYRAVPSVGPGAQWFMIDKLGFDKIFFGGLAQMGAVLSILGLWFFSKWMTERPVREILTVLTCVSFILGLPLIAMYYGLHEWTMTHWGFGAKSIAVVDTALASPLDQLAMVPMLTLIAKYAPKENTATWFALMASFMNLALMAGGIFSRWLNLAFPVQRAVLGPTGNILIPEDYSHLGILLWVVSLVGLIIPLLAIWLGLKK